MNNEHLEKREKLLKLQVELMRRKGLTKSDVEKLSKQSRQKLMRTEEEILETSDWKRLNDEVDEYKRLEKLNNQPRLLKWLKQLFCILKEHKLVGDQK